MRVLNWIDQRPTAGDIPVWVDVPKLDIAWQRDRRHYLSPDKAPLTHKYRRFGEWIANGHPIWRPLVSFKDNVIAFTDGRHRFAWLRGHGVKAVPVAASDTYAEVIRRSFGTKNRRSIL
jgi:hypothetical protein